MSSLEDNLSRVQSFHCPSNNSIKKAKNLAKTIFFLSFFTFVIIGIFFLNIVVAKRNVDKSFRDIFISLFFTDWSDTATVFNTDFVPIKRIIWINFAAIIAGMLLSISASIAQSITQNPLADSTILGMVDASIFGIILMKTFFGNSFDGTKYHLFYLFFSFFGSAIILFFLIFFFNKKHNKGSYVKVVLFGLILNIFFRTLVHLMKNYNANSVNSAFALAIGGSENVYDLFPQQFTVLKISFVVLIIVFVVSMAFARQFNLAELGDEQAQSLGVNMKRLKFFGYLIMLFCTTIAITLAGNISFIGLISTHFIRRLFRTRKYQIIIPLSVIFSACMLIMCVMWNIFFPKLSSSIFILFFGSIFLLYITQKNNNA